MALIVQKFGGSSVADVDRVRHVAGIITDTYKAGNDVVVVLSAQGKTTDKLLAMAEQYNPKASKRELDQLLSTGEQQSVALCAMMIQSMGFPVVSLNAWQVGFKTNSTYGNARIKKIETDRIQNELDQHRIVIFTGFQGINKWEDVTTLGRGGSDTSAVALAAALRADKCQIYTDVDGVYTADPNKVPTAKKIDQITYDEMLELASLGAQVLNNRSVELAKKYGVELEVLSSLNPVPGTVVKEVAKDMEGMLIKGVAKDTDVAVITIMDVPDVPGMSFKVFGILAQKKINVDIILQAGGRDNTKDLTFTVPLGDAETAISVLEENKARYGGGNVKLRTDFAKVSIVGAGMQSHSGVASRMFEALYESNINIHMISTSEIKISVIIEKKDADRAVAAIHDAFIH